MNKSLVLVFIIISFFLNGCKTVDKIQEIVSSDTPSSDTSGILTNQKQGYKEERLTEYKWLITYQGPTTTKESQALNLLHKHINEFGKAQCKGRFQTEQATSQQVTQDDKPLYVEASAILSCDK